MDVATVTERFDERLDVGAYADVDASANGLQVGPAHRGVERVAFAVDSIVASTLDSTAADSSCGTGFLALAEPTQSTADPVGRVARGRNDPRVVTARRRVRMTPTARRGRSRDPRQRVQVREVAVGVDSERRAVDRPCQPERRGRLAAASLPSGDGEHTVAGPVSVFERSGPDENESKTADSPG